MLIFDLLVDYCFDSMWYYGLFEFMCEKWCGEKKISNFGCYVIVIQFLIVLLKDLLVVLLVCFGVLGYFGVGIMFLDKNDFEKLCDNLMLYLFIGYIYEKEVSCYFGVLVEFMLYVVLYFCGFIVIINFYFVCKMICEEVMQCFYYVYDVELLVYVVDEVLWVSVVVGKYYVDIGGFVVFVDGKCVVVVVMLDNLFKGVVIQVLQNINWVIGVDEFIVILIIL